MRLHVTACITTYTRHTQRALFRKWIMLTFRSTSDHNKMVQAAIVAEIVGQPNSNIKEETARGMSVQLAPL